MEKEKIKYKDVTGYKYKLDEDYCIYIDILQKKINHKCIKLDQFGFLTIKKCYQWDGPSGPAIDTKNFMRGSLIHDALYQLMRLGLLEIIHRNYVDRLLQEICIKDGMSKIRAWWVYQGVDKFAKKYARKQKEEIKIYTAP
jgi:hypothetical protein